MSKATAMADRFREMAKMDNPNHIADYVKDMLVDSLEWNIDMLELLNAMPHIEEEEGEDYE